jgi:glutamate synthase (NADPH/NADH) large chain
MTTAAEKTELHTSGLYDPAHEHDACGVGFVAHIKGVKSHAIVQQGLKILENLDHRGAVGADKLMGDGAGILIQLPDCAVPRRNGQAGRDLAAAGRIRRRHDLPAQGARQPPGL